MENPNLIKPLYSVIVLIFHRTPELVTIAHECIASIKKHSSNYELIIVDNGSTERYEWEKECDVYVRLDKNMGISHAWNTGLRVARGRYMVILGDDTVVSRGWLEGLQKAMDMPQAGLANIHVEHLPEGIDVVENYKWFSHACVMLTKETIKNVGYYDQDTYFPCNWEDVDYSTRVYKAGLKCYVNYDVSIKHKEGQTLHAKDLSQHFMRLKQAFIDKHGFDPTPAFYGDASLHDFLRASK